MQYIVDQHYTGPMNYSYQDGTASHPSDAFIQLFASDTNNDTGIPLTLDKAIGNPAVWTSASKICGHLAQMALDCMRWVNRKDEEAEVEFNHPAQYLLNYQFSDQIAADVGKETLALHALIRGNGRALIVRNARYDASELIILDPDETATVVVRKEGSPVREKWHVWKDPNTGKMYPYPDRDVFHICGLSGDGMRGYDTIKIAGNAIGGGLLAEKRANRFLKNRSVPSLILEAPAGMFKKEEEARTFLEGFRKAHSEENEGTVGMLRDNVKANVIAVDAQKSQLIEQRKFSREDMALLFGVEQMLGIDKSVSYNSEEQRSKAYRVNCLGRWMTRWAGEARRKLLSAAQQRADSHFFMWNDEILLQATLAERYEGYSKAIASRILSPNEVRKKEGYRPYDGGDTYENPNTSTPSSPSTVAEPTEDEDESDDQPQQNRNATAVANHIDHLVNVEKKRLLQMARQPKKFITKMEKFYGGWAERFGKTVAQFGGDSFLVGEWIDEGKRRMLEVSGTAGEADLLQAVASDLEQWSERTQELINSITELTQ